MKTVDCNKPDAKEKKDAKKNFFICWDVFAFPLRLAPNPLRLCVEKIRAFVLAIEPLVNDVSPPQHLATLQLLFLTQTFGSPAP